MEKVRDVRNYNGCRFRIIA